MWMLLAEPSGQFGRLIRVSIFGKSGITYSFFVFELENDAERVLTNESWSFDKHLVLFR